MTSDVPDFSAQRAFIAAKVAAANAAAVAEDVALAIAQRDFASIFGGYFGVAPLESRAKRQTFTRRQFTALAGAFDCWWLFGGEENELAVGFNSRLVAAAADFAICKALTPPGDAPPTPVDRSIAAALARRLTSAGAEESDPAFVPTLMKAATDLDSALSPGDAEQWRLLTFSGRFPNDGGEFTVIVARPGRSGQADANALSSHLTAENIDKVKNISVTAQCLGGYFEAPLQRILALKPGDVVPIRWNGDGAAPLMLGGRQFAAGTLGDHNGRRAIRL